MGLGVLIAWLHKSWKEKKLLEGLQIEDDKSRLIIEDLTKSVMNIHQISPRKKIERKNSLPPCLKNY